MIEWRNPREWMQLFRYYQAGIVNMLFGYALFALLVFAGMQVFLAQLVGHFLGVVFNYFTYSRYAFANHEANKASFVASYVGNYFLGLAGLWGALQIIESPYVAGLIVTIAVSAVNYFVLKLLVFRSAPTSDGSKA